MEKKQLNFSAPLLSAKRYSSPLRSCSFCGEESKKNDSLTVRKNTVLSGQPDLNLGEVVKPGSVPFLWEQHPGRAKGDSRVHSPEADEDPSTAPRLPPGKNFDFPPRISGVKSGELTSFPRPPPVQRFSGELNLIRPHNKLSGELNLIRPQGKFSGELGGLLREPNRSPSFPTNGLAMRSNFSTKGFKKKGDSRSETDGDDDDDFAFSDGLDALESFSMNCSTSGLSASDNRGARPSKTFSPDVENRDFMINRFLPAAKAMTLESPQYASKRQLLVVEQPLPLSKAIIPKIVKEVPPPPPLPQTEKNMSITLYKGQDVKPQQSEEDEDDSSVDARNNNNSITVRSCGFFPWFCSKNALRFLNPVPAMKVKTRNALASASKVGKTFVKNASHGSPAHSISKHVPCTTHVHKVESATKSCELHRIEPKRNGYNPRPMFYSGELSTRNSDLQARNGLSPYRNYRRTSVSPYRNESPHSPFHQGASYLIVPKLVNQPNSHAPKPVDRSSNFSGPILSHRRNLHVLTGQECPIAEKTLYVYSANITQSFRSSGRTHILKAREMSKPLVCGTLDADPPPSLDCGLAKKSSHSFERSRLLMDKLMDKHEQVNPGKEMVLRSEDLAMKSPAPPPLPKSPSESWLSRNLNSVSPRNSFSYTNGGAKFQARKKSPVKTPPSIGNAKWETIVKSSHQPCDHWQYSEELVARVVPKQSHIRK